MHQKISSKIAEATKREKFLYKIFDLIIKSKYLTRFRIAALDVWSTSDNAYNTEKYAVQVNFFHIPFWWIVVNTHYYFSQAMKARNELLLLQTRPDKIRVVKKDEEIFDMMKEDNKEGE